MQSGTTLAHYRVEELVGKGGMGEVYRARDTKLDRDVALKILPAEFASDPERMARFEREARVLASLHHPNIASIFGFENTGDCTFLVMELVEGEDLSVLLEQGALPLDDAVDIARQIAEGLEEAHEKGIVHRDLKPANVKRTADGKVKVLDFGLARAYAGQAAAEEDVSSAPTLTAAMTQLGTVMGTAAYMSPEQARGQEVDRRADIWAFGVILFEMLTGRRLFEGETASDTLAGILKSEPDWGQLPDGLPYQVDRVLRRCLAKEPRQRLRDIGEARIRLEDPHAESGLLSGPVTAMPDPDRGGRLGRLLPWGLVAVGLVAVAWLQWTSNGGKESGILHLALPTPAEADFHINGSFPGLPEVSPDGRRVVFSGVSRDDNSIQLYMRALDQIDAVPLGGTKDAQYPFWSPDGKWAAYYARNDGLMKIMVDGGPSQLICPAGNGKGGSWNQTDDILFTTDYNSAIFTVSAAGGDPRQITDLAGDEGFNSHRHPQFMPDGRHFLYLARGSGKNQSEIRLASLDGGPFKVVMQAPAMGYYAAGYLVYLNRNALMARPFDPTTGEVSGSPRLLVDEVMTVSGAAKGVFSVSTGGTLVYMKGEGAVDSRISWRDRHGTEIAQVGEPGSYDILALAPDDLSAAVGVVVEQSGTWDMWVFDLERNFPTRLTFDISDEFDVVWRRDGRALYFVSDRDGAMAVYVKEVGNPAPPEKVFEDGEDIRLWDSSADGRTIFYSTPGAGSAWDLWSTDVNGEREPQLLYRSAEHDIRARLSPDENWLTFSTNESGLAQVYVAPWPAMAPVTQVSKVSGTWSEWTRGGSELVFQKLTGELVAVSMNVREGRMIIGEPQELFGIAPPVLEAVYWSATADGERFLMIDTDNRSAPPHCNVMLGWTEVLEDR